MSRPVLGFAFFGLGRTMSEQRSFVLLPASIVHYREALKRVGQLRAIVQRRFFEISNAESASSSQVP